MREYDVDYTADQLESIAKRLHDAAEHVTVSAARLREKKSFGEVGKVINDLLWLVPNLHLDTLHNEVVRQLEVKAQPKD